MQPSQMNHPGLGWRVWREESYQLLRLDTSVMWSEWEKLFNVPQCFSYSGMLRRVSGNLNLKLLLVVQPWTGSHVFSKNCHKISKTSWIGPRRTPLEVHAGPLVVHAGPLVVPLQDGMQAGARSVQTPGGRQREFGSFVSNLPAPARHHHHSRCGWSRWRGWCRADRPITEIFQEGACL